jgi:hypothetical protein
LRLLQRARARQFQPQCQACTEWKLEILKHHLNRNGDVYWGNCQPGGGPSTRGRWPRPSCPEDWQTNEIPRSVMLQLF